MSHYTVWKTCIENITKQQLHDAINLLSKLLDGAEIIYQNETWQGETQTFDIGIKVPGSLERGIGFSVCDGKVYIHGDPYNQDQMFNRIKEIVEKGSIFAASKIAQAAKNNRKVVTKTRLEESEIIMEVEA
jgi:hypothetical protein